MMVEVKNRNVLFGLCLSLFLLSTTTLIMAYNREWDRGKDSWDEGHSWQSSEYRSNVRERDDDYDYNDNKRRKYNNGVSTANLAYTQVLVFIKHVRRATRMPTITTNLLHILHLIIIDVKTSGLMITPLTIAQEDQGEDQEGELLESVSSLLSPVPMSFSLD